MAQRRMFSLKIVDTDAFLDMPQSSQLLYFHLSMRADDDGFVSNPKKIMRIIGSQDDDIKVLFTKRFVLPFDSGVCVIKHWKIHNYIQSDRYMPTQWVKEMAQLEVDDETQKYKLKKGEDNVSKMYPQDRLGKVRLESGKERVETPAQKMVNFIQSVKDENDKFNEIITSLENMGVPKEVSKGEIKKFVSYWTEKNKSGTKERWEIQSTFEVNRRLATWFNKVREFSKADKIKSKIAFL